MNRIHAKGKTFTDELGRERVFSGVNIVDKSPYTTGVQSVPDVTEDTIAQLHARGFNLIRLGFTWGKLEPQPGVYNDGYLDAVGTVLDWCEKYDVYAFLDMHQDLYSPVTNGDGAPPWAALTDGRKATPTRFVWAEDYFWGRACHRCFDHFWNNTPVQGKGLQDRFADLWKHVIEKLGDKPAVIGFDLLNEPFPGTDGGRVFRRLVRTAVRTGLTDKAVDRGQIVRDLFSEARGEKLFGHLTSDLLRKVTHSADTLIENFDRVQYTRFLMRMAEAVRTVNGDKLIFMENSYYSNLGIPFSAPPIYTDGERDPQQVFAPHAYDLMVDTPAYKYASNDRVGSIFAEHRRSQERLNMPVVVGEWGGFGGDDAGWLPHIDFLLRLFDENKWSNTYWCYKKDFFASPLMQVFVRAFPRAVDGTLKSYTYDSSAKVFRMELLQTGTLPAEIAAPFAVQSVLLDGEAAEFIQRDAVLFVQIPAGNHTLEVRF